MYFKNLLTIASAILLAGNSMATPALVRRIATDPSLFPHNTSSRTVYANISI